MFYSFETGRPLQQIDQDYNQYITTVLISHHQMSTMILINGLLISLVRVLLGKRTGIEFSPVSNAHRWADAHKITLSAIFCQYQEVVKLGKTFLKAIPYEQFDLVSVYLYVGIANIALFKECGMRYRGMIMFARRCLKKIDRICTSATDYSLGRLTLLEAELSSISLRRHGNTVRKYLYAIGLADSSKNPFEGAFAHERYGRYLCEYGDVPKSLSHLHKACALYHEWNAYRKAEMVEEEIETIARSIRSNLSSS